MGVGFGIGPNGQFGPVITMDGGSSDSRPSSYDYTFETTDGIQIDVTVNTKNESRAETIRKDMEEKLKLTSIEAPDAPPSIGGAIGYGLGFAILAFFLVPILVGFFAEIFHAAGFIQVDVLDDQTFNVGHFFARLALGSAALAFVATFIGGIIDLLNARKSATSLIK